MSASRDMRVVVFVTIVLSSLPDLLLTRKAIQTKLDNCVASRGGDDSRWSKVLLVWKTRHERTLFKINCFCGLVGGCHKRASLIRCDVCEWEIYSKMSHF